MRLETKELAKLLVNSQNLASHPDGSGRRLVGYVISDEHYPSDGLFALRHISNVFNSHDRLTAEVARLRDALAAIASQTSDGWAADLARHTINPEEPT